MPANASKSKRAKASKRKAVAKPPRRSGRVSLVGPAPVPASAPADAPNVQDLVATTQQHLARLFGVSVVTVQTWISQGAPPRVASGYSVREWIAWRLARGTTGSAAEVDLDKKRVNLELSRIELEQKRGALVDARAAAEDRRKLVRWFVSVMDRAGPELSVQISGQRPSEARRVVQAYFDAVRQQAVEQDGKAGKVR